MHLIRHLGTTHVVTGELTPQMHVLNYGLHAESMGSVNAGACSK